MKRTTRISPVSKRRAAEIEAGKHRRVGGSTFTVTADAPKKRVRGRRKKSGERFRERFGPPGFAEFVRALPCVRCKKTPSVPHHDPTQKNGGTWVDVSPVCEDCHNRIRHGLNGGVRKFWGDVGMSYSESNKLTQMKWLARDSR